MAGDEGVEKSSGTEDQPSGSPTPVFVSYASQDAAVANSVVENLEQHGLKCWIAPRDVPPGSQYADEIVGAINNAKILVLVLSEHAVASAHVGREIERAASKQRRIIVLHTDAAPLTRSFEYFLSESQWIDVAALGVPAALTKLTQAVGQRLAPSSWVSPGLGADVRDPAEQSRRPSYLKIKRAIPAAVFLVAAAVVIGVLVRYWPSKQGTSQAQAVAAVAEKSIAVLPFVDMSEKKDQEYFADGMAEEIIDLLVKIPSVKVIGRTSSFQFKGQSQDLRAIGSKLGARYVLEGSVRKAGDRLRVTAQLIDSTDGTHLFSKTYDRDLSDILKMQDEIAASLVRALQIEVSPEGMVSRRTLPNTEAYTFYLKGLHAFDRYDKQGFEQAVSYFQHAHSLDPKFAPAAGGLADTYFLLGMLRFLPLTEAIENARKSAEVALQLEPNYAGAHAVLGSIYSAYDWDWTAADREYERARILAPNDVHVLWASAIFAHIMGRPDEALKFANACVDLAPLDPRCYGPVSEIQASSGRLVEAEAAARRTLEISPTSNLAHTVIGDVLLARNEPEAALGEFSKEPWESARLARSSIAYFAMGRRVESDAALAALESQSNVSFFLAEVYAFRGQQDDAFKWLERAYADKDTQLSLLKLDPRLRSLHNDPRYAAFLKKMKFPEG